VYPWKKNKKFNSSDLFKTPYYTKKINSRQKLLMVRYSLYLRRWLWVIIFKKRVWCRLSSTSMELKCKELKTCLLLFFFNNSKFESIQNHLNPMNYWVNSTSIEKRNNSLNEDLLEKQWRNKKYGFSILLHLKLNTKKTNSIQIKSYSIEKSEK
jgi:hypothetical protein